MTNSLKRVTKLRIAALTGIVLAGAAQWDVQAANLTDMVVVRAAKPFFIDIFEATCAGVGAIISGSCGMGDSSWKPARVDGPTAADYCSRIGKSLPTLEQWRAAATNLGRNKRFTLIGDTLYDGSRLKVNIRGSASERPSDFGALGIDAIGTVGMTGNRYEWVSTGNAGSPWAQCGGQYETQNDADVEMANICIVDPARFAQTATARCVQAYDKNLVLDYTGSVSGALKAYLDQLAAQPQVLPLPETQGDSPLDEILIPANDYTQSDVTDPDLLDQPEPNYDDEL